MTNNINKDKSIKHLCNILTDILNPTKFAKIKPYYAPILQGCMNTCSRRALFRNLRILLDSEISSTIIMGDLMSKLKQKTLQKPCGKPNQGNSRPKRR